MIAHATKNQRGFTYQLTHCGQAFIEEAATARYPVVDIGAAFGVATLPALAKEANVIAVDVSPEHLAILTKNTPTHFQDRLTVQAGRFPDITLPTTPVSAVYLSQVLPFLSPDEVHKGAKVIYDWLVPGGKVFIVSFTPFLSHVADYLPIYEQKKQLGESFAGYITDLPAYCSHPAIAHQLPSVINHVDEDDLRLVFETTGFDILHLATFGDENNDLPEGIKYDGRERVGLIAQKPIDV